MAGKGDEAAGLWERLNRLLDAEVAALEAPGADVALVDKRARAITALARAAKSIEAIRPEADEPDDDEQTPERTDMDEPDEAAEIERLEAELKARLEHIALKLEEKRAEQRAERDIDRAAGRGGGGRPATGVGRPGPA